MSGHLKWLPGILSSYNHIIKNQDETKPVLYYLGDRMKCVTCVELIKRMRQLGQIPVMVGGARQ